MDDIICIFNNSSSPDSFLTFINSVEPSIKFTVEHAINKCIPFLDVNISCINGCFQFEVYRKPTHTGLLLNFFADCPLRYKTGLVRCLIHRAFHISSSWKAFCKELDNLKFMFLKNGYPIEFIELCFRKFFTVVFSNTTITKLDHVKNTVILDYYGNVSTNFGKKFLKLCKSFGIECNIVFKTRKLSSFFSLKTLVPLELRSMAVYSFSCPDAQDKPLYIGKTTRHLISRIKEHKARRDSSIFDHLSSCNSHANFFKNFKILATTRSDFDLKISESLLIKKHRPHLNIKSIDSWNYTLRLF